jgi:hypothetical protein
VSFILGLIQFSCLGRRGRAVDNRLESGRR